MTMDSAAPGQPTPPAEAALIRLAREAKAVSPETAAAGMPFRFSGSSWRQIEAGFRGRARTPVHAKASILAHMARVVGVTADRLEEADRADAAAVMREIEAQEADREREPAPPPVAMDPRWRMLEASITAAAEGLSRKERAQLRAEIEQFLSANPDWQPDGPDRTGEEQDPRRAG